MKKTKRRVEATGYTRPGFWIGKGIWPNQYLTPSQIVVVKDMAAAEARLSGKAVKVKLIIQEV